eukprot:TRINITY_DN32_c0_g2_i1.p1 TRINITY_DN32_c0_g2~~TRINITY_DN32_c0_g2_i1.p1  ORF type:complete len:2201 (+),score=443.14 TRINITY_DN32_c0_g2_i1:110-6604(+)
MATAAKLGCVLAAAVALPGAAAELPAFLPNGWRRLLPDPVGTAEARRLIDHCSTGHDGKLYVHGGENAAGAGGTATMWVYDIALPQVTAIDPANGATWPPTRYKCKMAADPRSGIIYMFGGKTKIPEKKEFTDFWAFDTRTQAWSELPSGGSNGPVAESMDGDLAIFGDQVVIAGADDGLHGKTFRYSISQQTWLPFVEDGATALNKPTLINIGMIGYLIGGYNAAGDFVEKLLTIDLSADPPVWRQLPQSGEVPRNDGMKGGALPDGSLVVLSNKGDVHRLDVSTGVWTILPPACGGPPARDDFAGSVIDGLLVIVGGTYGEVPFAGDLQAFSPARRGYPLPCMNAVRGQYVELIADPAGRSEQLRLIDHCSAAYQDKLYVFGGENPVSGAGGDPQLKVYDLTTLALRSIQPPAGAAWPSSRYKCKMDFDSAAGKLYMFGGKTKVPGKAEFTDFWVFDTANGRWAELPSGGENGPVAESMDGDLAVINGQVVIAGADDGLHGKTFRYSIAQGTWLPFVEDGATALNKPTLVRSGTKGYLIGGYNAAGSFVEKLLMIDLSAEPPFWRQLPQSGAVPRNDGMKGGALSDGSVVVLNPKGTVHSLDTATGVWSIIPAACGAVPRDDMAGDVIDDYLVIFGGAAGDDEFRGDLVVFSPYNRGGSGGCSSWLAGTAGRWQKILEHNETAVIDHCSAALGRKMYVIGGEDAAGAGGASTRRLRVYDVEAKTVSVIDPPPAAPWPAGRYKCKFSADETSGKLYLFGGKTKIPEKKEFTDFWEYDTASGTWTELPSGGDNGPVAESMDGDLQVAAGLVVIAGADDGLHGKTFRYSIAQKEWLAFVEDGATALNKPLLVAVGSKGYLIGGYDAAGVVSQSLLTIDLSATTPFWKQEQQSGAIPVNDALKGGAAADGNSILVYSSKGSLHVLDLATSTWSSKSSGCHWIPTRDDYAGEIVDGVLVVMGGANDGSAFLGDLWAYIPGEDSAKCGSSGGVDGTGPEEEYQGIPLDRSVKKLRLLEQGYRGEGGTFAQTDFKNSGICFSTRRFFVALSDQDDAVAVFPDSLQPQSGVVLSSTALSYGHHTGLTCDTAADRLYVLHQQKQTLLGTAEQAFVSEFSRDGERLALVSTLPTGLPAACGTVDKLCSWGLAKYAHRGEQYLLLMQQTAKDPAAAGNGTVWVLRRGIAGYVVVTELLTPWVMADYTGLAVDALGRVLITSLKESRMLVAQLKTDQDQLMFDPSVAAVFDFPRQPDGSHAHCNVAGVTWITNATGGAEMDEEGRLSLATISGSRHGSTQGPNCLAEELSINIWKLPADYASVTREEVLQRILVTPAPTASSGSFNERMEASEQPWVFLGGHPSVVRLEHSAAAVNGTMYVFGGQDAVGVNSADLLTLRIPDLAWDVAPKPLGALWPPPRRRGQMVSDERRGTLYLLGGLFSDGLTESPLYDFWQYNTATAAWAQLPSFKNGERYAPGPVQGTSFQAASTLHYIIVVGCSEGAQSTWMVFDKATDTWLAPFADRRLAVETPAIAAVTPEVVIAVGGIRTTRGSYTPQQTLRLSTTGNPDRWVWESISASSTAPSGDRLTARAIGQGAAVLIGDPRGQGPLGAVGGVAAIKGSLSQWAVVNRTEQWMELRSGFSTVEHDGRLIVFGGAVGSGDRAVVTGELWGYSPRKCPADCNGRGTCELGNCINCRGSSGVSCDVLDPGETNWILIIIIAACGLFVVFAILGIFLWRSTAEMRKYRSLYDTARVAEDMASQIALMDLEGLEYLRDIESPSATQRAFLSIVDTLQQYRAYLPQSLLQGVKGDDEDEDFGGSLTKSGSGTSIGQSSQKQPGSPKSSRQLKGMCSDPSGQLHKGFSSRASIAQSALSRMDHRKGGANAAARTRDLTELGVTRKDCSFASVSGRNLVSAFSGLSDADYTQNHGAMLQRVLSQCEICKGVAEPFDGDRICVTFGALGRPGMHSLNCCLFMHQLTCSPEGGMVPVDLPTGVQLQLYVGGARGKAAVGNLGTNTARKFSVIGYCTLAARCLENVAPGLQCPCIWAPLVVNGNEVNEFHMMYVGRAMVNRRSVKLMYPKNRVKSDNDEWMYQMASAAESHPFSRINVAFDLFYDQQVPPDEELPRTSALSPGIDILLQAVKRAAEGHKPNIPLFVPAFLESAAAEVDMLRQ